MHRAAAVCLAMALLTAGQTARANPCKSARVIETAAPDQVTQFFAAQRRDVVTFFGYSGAGYEDTAAMLRQAETMLRRFEPAKTFVNIGATSAGVGAIYELAKRLGFDTTGIVSSQAQDQKVPLSPCVDLVFYVRDLSWGGYLPGTTELSPTSKAMLAVSDVLIAIGGGDVARDELREATRRKKPVTFIPADMNHRTARDKAASKGQPAPSDFRGSAHCVLAPRDC